MKKRKLSNKERLDIQTMVYFIPTAAKRRIYPNDKLKMADLSSRGIKPQRITKGYSALLLGKTYRDEQITSYIRDVRLGFFTKAELIESMPPRFRPWLENKLRSVPYDVDGNTGRMFIKMYQSGEY